VTIREQIEQRERETLRPWAALAAQSRGRQRPEEPCPVRTCFQRDRDRIIHLCHAFRRLAHMTQVFISPREDHVRTRLSHTLEVSQIARTVAKALRLNEDLTEAIALGHDVGHTPFGHAGEQALDEIYRKYVPTAPFSPPEHSLRVVDVLERDGKGLNLSYETRDGIVGHSKGMADLADDMANNKLATLEGMVIRVCDRIAYLNHDLDDAMRAGLLSEDDVPGEILDVLGRTHSERVGTMVRDLIANSLDKPFLAMSAEVLEAADALKNLLWERVYAGPLISHEAAKARGIVQGLFTVYMEDDTACRKALGYVPEDVQHRARVVCDYVAGMTDHFARAQYIRYFLPSGYPSFDD